jgi:hypothetical protein
MGRKGVGFTEYESSVFEGTGAGIVHISSVLPLRKSISEYGSTRLFVGLTPPSRVINSLAGTSESPSSFGVGWVQWINVALLTAQKISLLYESDARCRTPRWSAAPLALGTSHEARHY